VVEAAWHRGRHRGGGAEKKILVDGGGGRGFTIHRCGNDGRADGVVPRRSDSVDPMAVEAVREVLVWTHQWWRW
jgi:hypothetical protein